MKNLNPIYDALNLQKWARSRSTENSNTVLKQSVRRQLHTEALTEENFHRVHLSHRRIEDFPNLTIHDIDRLKSMNVHTIQDLLGRCLIHDTLDEFHMFLLNGIRLSEESASAITNLFNQWINYNLNGVQSNH
ncbi:unnamed protein product [Adineta ricciae]|uniref:Uncharacterized protein n=1 Tax=Adineta ricciae TaxID=249248 RepID=A0A814IW69_ADIRI|nr:unnamed protein product [Adineta ricciae]